MREKRTFSRIVKVELLIYDRPEYEKDATVVKVQRYENLEWWEVVTGKDAKKLEDATDGTCIDPKHQYIVLHFADGTEATFRKNYVLMFPCAKFADWEKELGICLN